MTTAKSIKSLSLKEARDTFISLNLIDEDLLNDLYPEGCTMEEAGDLFEAIGCADADQESILDAPTTGLLDAFIAALDGDDVISNQFFTHSSAGQAAAFRRSLKIIICGFRTLPISSQAQFLAQGLACELDTRPEQSRRDRRTKNK